MMKVKDEIICMLLKINMFLTTIENDVTQYTESSQLIVIDKWRQVKM